MHEALDLGARGGAHRADLVERHGPFENHAREAAAFEKLRMPGRQGVHLGRGVQLHGQVHAPQRHVLHDKRIDPRADQLAGLALGLLQLVVAEQGVERGVDPHAVAAGVLHGPRDLRGIVGRGMARTEAGAADVHGVGAVVHGRDHRLAVAGRGQQFDGSLGGRHRGTDSASGQAQRFSG